MKSKRVWLMSGLPGSGKSTWVQKAIKKNGGIWHSRDKVRFSIVTENEPYFKKENKVFKIWINNIQESLDDNVTDNIYIDATHLTKNSREKVLDSLNLKDAEIYVVNFLIPLEICQKRNAKRQGREKVPNDVLKSMNLSFIPATHIEKYTYTRIINITIDNEDEVD